MKKNIIIKDIMNINYRIFSEMDTICEIDNLNVSFIIKENQPYKVQRDINTKKIKYIPIGILNQSSSLHEAISQLLGTSYIALVENEHEEIVGYITLEKLAKTVLVEYEKQGAFLETILYTSEDSCTAINKDAEVVSWSKGAEKLFSIDGNEIVGKPITDYFSEGNLEILNTLEKGTTVYHHQHHARDNLVVLINSNPVIYNDEIIGAVVSEKNITSQIHLYNELYKTSERLFNLEEKVMKSNAENDPFFYIKGSSDPLQKTLNIAKKAAKTDASILVFGESGVGKELFAKAIHKIRESDSSPYVAINCGAISSSLFESEIFGYERGAFSGADLKGKKGKAELAKGGTLFLDEIGEMPLEMQVKFLRLLQEKKFYRVGGTEEVEVDFRIVAATNRDLKEMVDKGEFREDLYYRLNVVCFNVPPLRERIHDIIELTHYFLYEISVKYNRPIHGISQDVMQSLLEYSWPGNIRELKNVIERLVVFSDNGEIKQDDLPAEFSKGEQLTLSNNKHSTQSATLKSQLQDVERDIIIRELKNVNNNKVLCAELLGITRATLYNRMNKLNIN